MRFVKHPACTSQTISFFSLYIRHFQKPYDHEPPDRILETEYSSQIDLPNYLRFTLGDLRFTLGELLTVRAEIITELILERADPVIF